MCKPALIDLVPHARIAFHSFRFLHTLHEHAGGEVGKWIPVSALDILGCVHEPDELAKVGLIAFGRSEATGTSLMVVSLTKAGANEILFTQSRLRRYQVLLQIYEESHKNHSRPVMVMLIAQFLSRNPAEVMIDVKVMVGEGLLKQETAGFGGPTQNYVSITANGVIAVEQGQCSAHRTGGPNMVVHGDFRQNSDNVTTTGPNSPVMTRSAHSQQTVTGNDLNELAGVIKQIRADMSRLKLTLEDAKDVEATLKGVEAQLEASRPHHGMIREGLQSLVLRFGEKISEKGAEAIFTWLPRLPLLLAAFQHTPT